MFVYIQVCECVSMCAFVYVFCVCVCQVLCGIADFISLGLCELQHPSQDFSRNVGADPRTYGVKGPHPLLCSAPNPDHLGAMV